MSPGRGTFHGRGYLYILDNKLCRLQVFDCEGIGQVCASEAQAQETDRLFGNVCVCAGRHSDVRLCHSGGNDCVHMFDLDERYDRYVPVVPSRFDAQQVRLHGPQHASSTAGWQHHSWQTNLCAFKLPSGCYTWYRSCNRWLLAQSRCICKDLHVYLT